MLREMAVSAEWVATGDLGALPELIGTDLDPEQARQLQGTLVFLFPELEVDGVRIFDMPGVVDWLALLHERIPHLVYFLEPSPALGALEGLLRTFVPAESRADATAAGEIHLTTETLARLAMHLAACAAYATDHGDDWAPIVDRFIEPLDDSIQGALVGTVREIIDSG